MEFIEHVADTPKMNPLVLSLAIFAAVVATAVIGFAAGMIFERWYISTAMARASKRLSRLVDHVVKTMNHAEQACQKLASSAATQLNAKQRERLQAGQAGLLSAVEALVEVTAIGEQNGEKPAATSAASPARTPVKWEQSPVDERSQVPDFSAFENNLGTLLSSPMGDASGLLMVQIDRFDQLLKRFGNTQASHLMRSMARVLVSAIRDEDLVCHLYDDTFCVLLQDIDIETGKEVANQIRKAVRAHRFRLDQSESEIHMTASFGYSRLSSSDCPELAMDRANTALSDSRKRGRNQLHVHDGVKMTLCHAG